MGKIIDLTGQKFCKLLVLEKTNKRDKRNYPLYKCKCDCGNVVYLPCNRLTSNKTKSCGCLLKETSNRNYKIKNYEGKRFGKLVATKRLPKYKNNYTYYECLCDCGNVCCKSSLSLVQGKTKSCGCEWHKRKIKKIIMSLMKNVHTFM